MLFYILQGCVAWVVITMVAISFTPSKYVFSIDPNALSSFWKNQHWCLPTHMLNKPWRFIRHTQIGSAGIGVVAFGGLYLVYGAEGIWCK